MLKFLAVLFVLLGSHLLASDTWTSSYETLLGKYVVVNDYEQTVESSVDYAKLRNSAIIKKIADELAAAPTPTKLSKSNQLAFWLNAYNFLTIKKVVDNPNIKKLSELNSLFTSVWKQPAGIVAGKEYSLDTIEHKIIRKKFKEPMVHFALVCAAISCPNIRSEVYTGDKLENQLSEQLRQFIGNRSKGVKIDIANKTVHLSKIFKWFSGDFDNKPLLWLYQRKIITKSILDEYSLGYLDYDWNINDIKRKKK